MEHWTREFHSAFIKEQDRVIREAIVLHGFNADDYEFIKEHCQLVTYPFDSFQHLYYHYGKRDEIRMISIESQPNIEPSIEINKCSISAKYY